MSQHLPVISGRKAVKAFADFGFEVLPHRGKGDHIILAKQGHPAILTVPDHKELKRGTLRSLIRDAGLTVDEFCAAL